MTNQPPYEFERYFADFNKNGFVSLGQLLQPEELQTLHEECFQLINKPTLSLEESNKKRLKSIRYKTPEVTVQLNPQGQSAKLDALLEKLVAHPLTESFLKQIYGDEPFFLSETVVRRSEIGSKPLSMHQDGFGGSVLAILLEDTTSRSGTTFFLPKSHRFPFSIREVGMDVHPKFYSWFGVPLIGPLGQACFFLGTTWHARYHNYSQQTPTALWFSFSTVRHYQGDDPMPTAEMMKSAGPRLAELMSYAKPKDISEINQKSLFESLANPQSAPPWMWGLKYVFKLIGLGFEGLRKIRKLFWRGQAKTAQAYR